MSFCKLQFPFHFRYSFFFHVMAPGLNKFYGEWLCHLYMLQSMRRSVPIRSKYHQLKNCPELIKLKLLIFLFYLKSFICMLYWLSINIYICTKCSCIKIHTRTNSFRRNKNMYYFFIIMLSYFDTFPIQCHEQFVQVVHVKIYMKKENDHD